MRGKRLGRLLLRTAAGLLALLAALIIGLRFYLSSRAALGLVAGQLGAVIGEPTQVGGAHLGLVGESTFHNVKVFDPGQPDQHPWLVLQDVEADLSALGAAFGARPTGIKVDGGRVELRFDRNGKLMTQLPAGKAGGAVPQVRLDRGQVILEQEGRPPFVMKGISGDLHSTREGMHLAAEVHDPTWGDWTVQAELVTGQKLELHASTPLSHVTMPMLTAIPFVPADTWKHVRIEGLTPAQLDLVVPLGPDKGEIDYRIVTAPRDAHLEVPSINLQTEKTEGEVRIENGKVQLRHVKGQYGGGTISLPSGDLDFTHPATRMWFDVHIAGVMLHDLPREWKVPTGVDGTLSGSADLRLVIENGKVRTRGTGEGLLEHPRVPLVHISQPIRFYLVSDNRGFHFRHQLPGHVADQTDTPAPAGRVLTAVEQDVQHLSSLPAQLTGQVLDGVGWLMQKPPAAVRRTVAAFQKPPGAAQQGPTYLEVDVSLDHIKIEELLTRLDLRLPYSIAGLADVQAHVAIPVNRPHDMKAYRVEGQATLPTLRVADIALTNVRAGVAYRDGILNLQKVTGDIPGPQRGGKDRAVGKLEGSARLGVVPLEELSLKVHLDNLPVDLLAVLVPGIQPRSSGGVSGDIQAHAPLRRLGEPAAWQGTAALSASRLDVLGLALLRPEMVLEVARGTARLTRLKASLEGTELSGSGSMQLAGTMAFEAEIRTGRLERNALGLLERRLPGTIKVTGPISARADLKGTLHPFELSTQGAVESGAMTVAGARIDSLRLTWKGDEQQIRIPTLEAQLYGGKVTGSAIVPLENNRSGSADLRLSNIRLPQIAEQMGNLPLRLEGTLSGTARASISPSTDKPRQLTMDMNLDSPQLRIQGIPATRLRATLGYRSGQADYRLEGNTLGGRFVLQGKAPFPMEPEAVQGPEIPAEPPPRETAPGAQGRLELRELRLDRLWPYVGLQETLAPLTGTFTLVLPFTWSAGGWPTGTGRFQVSGLRWEAEDLADAVMGTIVLRQGSLRVQNFTAAVGEGSIEGGLTLRLARRLEGWFHVSLQQVSVSRLLVFYPDLRRNFQGVFDAVIRGQVGSEWNGGGTLVLNHARIYGLEVTQWRIPMSFRLVPAEGNGEVTVSDSTAEIARGRAQGNGRLTWAAGLDVRSKIRFSDVDMATLLRGLGSLGSYAAGKVTGDADISGDQVHTVDDLRATVSARLRETQALQLPILQQLTPYLRPGISSTTFQSGSLKGRLARGVFHVERLALASELLELILIGTVTLAGRLDLDVSTRTGVMINNTGRLGFLGQQLRLVGTLPLALVTQAASLLANRVVHLRITGTFSSPVIQVLPGTLLPQEAIRFFLLGGMDASLP